MVQGVLDGFDGAKITNYSAAIKGLSLNQAQLLLSTQGLNSERSKEILIEAGLLASENAIQAELLESTLIKAGLNKEEREAILNKLGLIQGEGAEAVAQGVCTAADLKAVLAQKLKNAEDAEGILAALGLAGANTGATVSFELLTKAIWKNIVAMAKWLVTNPFGLTALIVGGIAVAVDLFSTSVEENNEAIEKATNNIEEYQNAIDELNSKEKEATDLYKEYASLMSKSNAYGLTKEEKENLLKISNQLVNTYGLEVQGIDAVTGAYVIGTSAINDYVEALRTERLEKQKEQTDTRNERINKNIDTIRWDLSALDKNKEILKDYENYNSYFSDIIEQWQLEDWENMGRTEVSSKVSDYWTSLHKRAQEHGINISVADNILAYINNPDFQKETNELSRKIQTTVNSVVKDIITNIQVENADTMTQSGESVLTSMLQTILPNIEDLDKDKVKEIQDKVNEFTGSYGYVFDELGLKNQQIQEKINSNTVGLSDYKDLLDNQMKQLQVIEQIFGATSEETNAFREQLNKSIENNAGLSFAQIAKTMSEADLDTTQFDKVTSAILKLDKAMSDGEITFSEYMDELDSATKDISLEDTFKGDTQSAKQFFGVLTTKGKSAIQNLAAQMQNGEISQKDYLTGIEDIVDYLSSLSTQSLNIFGADDETTKEINSIVEGISTAKTELEAFKGVIQLMPDTFAEMQAMGTSTVNNLATALENAGITSLEVGDKVYQGSKQIAQAIKTDEAAFNAAQKKIAEETKNRLVAIGTGVAKLINGMINLFGDISFAITPPDKSLFEWAWDFITGGKEKAGEFDFGIKVGGTVDEGAFGNLFADAFGDIDWGFDDFTGGGGGNPPPKTPPGDGDKDKNTPDYEDPTDAIINRINLPSKELEQQEESIQNAIEIAELEKDYEKQISSTNDLIAKRKDRLTKLETANNWHHNEAEYQRSIHTFYNEDGSESDENLWFDSQGNATEYYNDLINKKGITTEEREAIEALFEKLSKYKKAYADNATEITDLNKQILQDEENLNELHTSLYEGNIRDIEHERDMVLNKDKNANVNAYYKKLQDEYHREAERLRALDPEKYKEDIQKLQQLWWDAQNEMLDYNKQVVDDFLNELQTKLDESYDIRISRLNSRSSLLSSHYGVLNAIKEEQHNLNKELLEAETIGARMNAQERETLFTKKEHARLSGKLKDVMDGINVLQQNYRSDLETATEDTIEEITNHYERQYELKMKEYEIVRAELDLMRKRQILENVENEKSVRTWNGSSWVYEANLQDVLDAQEELANAEYELEKAKIEELQQHELNALDANADALQTEKNRLATAIDEMAEKMEGSGTQITDMLKTIAETDLPTFDAIVQAFGGTLKNSLGISDDTIQKYRRDGESALLAEMQENSSKWHNVSEDERKDLEADNRRIADILGLDYDESTGRWKKPDGTYAYASGTQSANKGLGLFDEKGFGSELILTDNGVLTQFNGGERVFSSEMADRLWEMAQENYTFGSPIIQSDIGKLIPVDDRISNAISNISNAFGDTYTIKDIQLNESEGGTLKGFIDFLKKKI